MIDQQCIQFKLCGERSRKLLPGLRTHMINEGLEVEQCLVISSTRDILLDPGELPAVGICQAARAGPMDLTTCERIIDQLRYRLIGRHRCEADVQCGGRCRSKVLEKVLHSV